jgi:hypothetical protein
MKDVGPIKIDQPAGTSSIEIAHELAGKLEIGKWDSNPVGVRQISAILVCAKWTENSGRNLAICIKFPDQLGEIKRYATKGLVGIYLFIEKDSHDCLLIRVKRNHWFTRRNYTEIISTHFLN